MPFAGREPTVRITYRGLDAVGGVGVAVARQAGGWRILDLVAGGAAARDGRIAVGDRLVFLAEGSSGPPLKTSALTLESVRALLRGVTGSVVRLGIAGSDDGVVEIPLVRDERGCDDLAGAAAKDVLDRTLALQQTLRGKKAAGALPATVHLRTGDTIACAVRAADPEHPRIAIAADREAVIPGGFIRAVELAASGGRPILRPLGGCAELLIGGAIDEPVAVELPYAQWVLTPAAPPRAADPQAAPRSLDASQAR